MFASNSFTLFLILATIAFIDAERFERSPIITDDVAQEYQFPYTVAIISNKKGYICSGGIIHTRFILSAAHCFVDRETKTFKTEMFMIYAGTSDHLAALGEKNSRVIFVTKIFIRIDYDFATRANDITVLELAEDLQINNVHIQKLDLPHRCLDLVAGERAIIAAFGSCEMKILASNDTHRIIDRINDGKLRHAKIEIVDKDSCGDARPYANFPIQDYHLLGKMVKDSTQKYGMCYGDSGSPLVYSIRTTGGKIYSVIFGVFIDAFDITCDGRTLPAIFTKVSFYKRFIDDAMKGKVNEHMRVRDIASERAQESS